MAQGGIDLVALPTDLSQGPKEFRFKGTGCKKAAEGVWGVGWCVCVGGWGAGGGRGAGGGVRGVVVSADWK